MLRLIFALACTFFMAMPTVLATQLEAKKNGVKVYAQPKKSSETITTLKKGDTVDAVVREKMYWKVKTANGKEGFVSFIKVKRLPGDDSRLGAAIQAAAQDSRDMDDVKSARSRSAVMGIRGLDENDETSFAGNVQPNMRMVYNMEDRKVSKKIVNRLADLVQSEIEQKMRKSTN